MFSSGLPCYRKPGRYTLEQNKILMIKRNDGLKKHNDSVSKGDNLLTDMYLIWCPLTALCSSSEGIEQ